MTESAKPTVPTPAEHGESVRIVTVAYNPGRELERFLASVRDATSLPLRIVIADNGAQHDVVEAAARKHGARVVGDGRNRGYGAGANLAAADLDEDWIVVANPDLVWEPGSLDTLIEAARANPRAGALGPRLLNPDGTVYPSGRALPSLFKGAGHALLGRIWPSNPFSSAYHNATREDAREERVVGWLSGACLLLPAAAWKRLGGFDEHYFMFFEDVDLGARIGKAGWLNMQVPGAVVIHEQGASWKARPERMIRAHHASARRYLCSVYSAPWQAPVRWVLSLGLWLREELAVRSSRRAQASQR
ncbi:glycosyltransferase family 2 protein [Actinomyces slackii]|uniref:dTDP-Rha:alpha-D-GlcNAc-pyrophosphate polyprenol, alpha-3-L-rhamnosyltransferase n=1 Tax=Actinomyces slackii TaxID=52774 RepID=A0A3S4UQF8_9ACTO|nr:glycosyltransferase family 2 protein [Actinomyces slackii]VEG75904.1 dTDP-Rha:alpha-D-GlcNAc-pyrophosphate polyprenol, alpha-3-L-rhamnosyltransferase [Actinomyces slackii]